MLPKFPLNFRFQKVVLLFFKLFSLLSEGVFRVVVTLVDDTIAFSLELLLFAPWFFSSCYIFSSWWRFGVFSFSGTFFLFALFSVFFTKGNVNHFISVINILVQFGFFSLIKNKIGI